jgi:hypothetical protein
VFDEVKKTLNVHLSESREAKINKISKSKNF